MRSFLLSCAALALIGCSTAASETLRPRQLIGQTESAVIAAHGLPDRTYRTGATHYLEYLDARAPIARPPQIRSDARGVPIITHDWGMNPVTEICTTMFTLEKGVVTRVRQSGSCR